MLRSHSWVPVSVLWICRWHPQGGPQVKHRNKLVYYALTQKEVHEGVFPVSVSPVKLATGDGTSGNEKLFSSALETEDFVHLIFINQHRLQVKNGGALFVWSTATATLLAMNYLAQCTFTPAPLAQCPPLYYAFMAEGSGGTGHLKCK